MMHSFPVTRSQLFFTNYCVGFLAAAVPDLIVDAICLPAISDPAQRGRLIVITIVSLLFFWSTAVLSVNVTGNAAGAAVTYCALNLAPVLLVIVFVNMFEEIVYGFSDRLVLSDLPLSPVLCVFETMEVGLAYALYYTGLCAVLTGLAFFAYKRRRLEQTGETFVFRVVK